MARVTAIFLSCVLLTASGLLASSVEETYQAALTQEKGEGNLEEAIRLYKQVVEAHEKGEGDEGLAARAQLRIGVCQEKLGLAQARQTYEAVRDKYPDQPQVGAEAARRLGSTHQREAVIEEPSDRTASESYIRRQLQQIMERAKRQMELTERQMETIQQQLTEQTKRQMEQVEQLTERAKRRMEQAKRDTGADSVFIDEQVRRQLEAVQRQMERQMEQAERQIEQAERQIEQTEQQLEALQRQLEQEPLERQRETIQRQGFHFEQIRPPRSERIRPPHPPYHPPHFLEHPAQQYYHYAYTPPVVPYAYEEVAKVPVHWKFRLNESKYPQQHRTYAALDFDDSDWDTIDIGQAWEDQGYRGYDEGAWYRARIEVNAKEGLPVLMAFGGADKDAFVYVNGTFVGEHHEWDRPFILDISNQVVRDGENIVALYVYDGENMGGVYGLINVHQPTDEVKTDDFAANQGGHLEMVPGGTGWPVLKDHFTSGKRYSRYARRPPRIPYAYNKVAEVPVQWKFSPYSEGYQDHQDAIYSHADFDDSDWADIDIGQAWEDQGYEGYDEGAWYRAQIEVDAEEGRPVHLAFGGVDNNAYVYVNGTFVGEHHGWNTPFILDISEAVNYKGQNVVAVRVYDGMEMGGIYGTIEVIQPTVKGNLDRYLANRGISAQQKQTDRDDEKKRSFWSRFF